MKALLAHLRSAGPAIIVAAVVCGPGSILTSSKVGAGFGYQLVWVLAVACVLMAGTTALAARIGASLPGTPCTEIATRLGRAPAAAVGVIIFLVVALFQSSNNIAVVASMESLGLPSGPGASLAVLLAVNAAIVALLYRSAHLYAPVEKLMKALVVVMVVAFVANAIAAHPSVAGILSGLVPRLPEDTTFFARLEHGAIQDPLLPVQGMIGTTFSVAGAFYQAYLVREKGWTTRDIPRGLVDSLAGITVLGTITLVILATSAAAFHGKVEAGSLASIGDVARQLEPLFRGWSRLIFGIGVLAGALSSFLVNAMVGGLLLSDGLGLGHRIDDRPARHLTTLALLAGFVVAALATATGASRVALIVLAQALTVLGGPALALALVYLGTRRGMNTPRWILALGVLGFLVTTALAVRTAVRLWLQLTGDVA